MNAGGQDLRSGATFGSPGTTDPSTPPAASEGVTRPGPATASWPAAAPAGDEQVENTPDARPEDVDDLVIRPFLLTGGRTRPAREDLRIETLIQSRPGPVPEGLRFEARLIVESCRQATSMAELAAAAKIPLGVARVLVSDLVDEGAVVVVQREELSVQLIERIRDRVRAL